MNSLGDFNSIWAVTEIYQKAACRQFQSKIESVRRLQIARNRRGIEWRRGSVSCLFLDFDGEALNLLV